ncbi:MAG: histidine--tRNA ligase [Candidatus Omnitrophica bacterium]|nr:histidine--tRNA ligase [Candidatus Omnitrophota bacterium]
MGINPKYRALKGMPDILPKDAKIYRVIEEKARKVFEDWEYDEIRTPILEETSVFVRSIGEDTDIVEKEMYTLEDRSGKSLSLRPEGTASIIRAYIEQGLYKDNDKVKLFYMGPMFRSERPQKGRLRQFHQIGVEIIGVCPPGIGDDIELILNAKRVLKEIGVEKYTIYVNSLGCKKDRDKYKRSLTGFFSGVRSKLCDNCERRISTNVLRVLDCKNKECKEVVQNAPRLLEYLCDECAGSYDNFKNTLSKIQIEFKEKTDLVRGLDYYTGVVFEIVHPGLGAQDAIAAGGRYDNLTKQMGGPESYATGYAIGVERLMLAIDKKREEFAIKRGTLVVAVGEDCRDEALFLTEKLRNEGMVCALDNSGRSLKAVMRKANKEKRRYVIIIGEEEIRNEKICLKNMDTGEQTDMTAEDVIEKLKKEKI